MSNFLKIRALGQELFHAEGQTDRQADRYDEANSRFSQFCGTRLKTLSSSGPQILLSMYLLKCRPIFFDHQAVWTSK